MGTDRKRTNKRILTIFGLAALVLAALALWGFSRGGNAPQSSAPAAAPQPAMPAMSEAQAKAEVRRLLTELDTFKGLSGFHDAGFSSKGLLSQPGRWRQDVTALQQRISEDRGLPPMLRAAPGQLLGLGLAYRQSKGQETRETESDRGMILTVLK